MTWPSGAGDSEWRLAWCETVPGDLSGQQCCVAWQARYAELSGVAWPALAWCAELSSMAWLGPLGGLLAGMGQPSAGLVRLYAGQDLSQW